ncbi:MAG TPA: hypothetical protein VGA38_00095 [Candidatus Limnocylindria bacterium]
MWSCFKECVSSVLPTLGYVEIVCIVAVLVAIVASGGTLTVPVILGVSAAFVVAGVGDTLLVCLAKCVL